MRRVIPTAFLVLGVAACGGGDASDEETTTTTRPTTTSTTTTTPAPAPEVDAAVYFMGPGGENRVRVGPFMLPVHRSVPDDGDLPSAVVTALLEGPAPDEQAAEISSAIPEGTELLGIEITDGIATVDLSSEFETGGGSLSMTARLAQLAATLTSLDGIDGVLLSIEGSPVDALGGEGVLIEEPLDLLSFEGLVPGILVQEPAWGAPVSDPVRISGVAAAFEAVFRLEVLDDEGTRVAAPDYVMTDDGTGWGRFSIELDLGVGGPADLTIRVWEESAEDGSTISERFVPVRLGG